MKSDNRTDEQIKQHYETEKELAKRLLNAPKHERANLAASLYDELYRSVPLHPQHTKKNSVEDGRRALEIQMRFLRPFLQNCKTFLEVGPGDCAVSLEVSKLVGTVYAVDVSSEITKINHIPDNFHFLLSDGCSVPLASGNADVAYSNQLMEHLHPDDAVEQLRNIYDVLAVGGRYLCVTPSRLTGPHDVSKYFDEVATGFHLKEYSISELYRIFHDVGFSKVKAYIRLPGGYIPISIIFLEFLERIVLSLPAGIRKPVARSLPFRVFLNMIRMVGIK